MENVENQNVEVTEVEETVEEVETPEINSNGDLDHEMILEKTKELELQTELLRKETLNLRLEREGLGVAKDFVNNFEITQDVDKQVDMIKQLINEIKLELSYKPSEMAKQEQYTQAIEQGDVNKALGFKFSKLFKK